MLDFIICVGGIYVCFLTWSTLQERVATQGYGANEEKFRYTIFLNTTQSLMASAIGYIYIRVFQKTHLPTLNKSQWKQLFQVAALNSVASPFGYMALRYINYPTMTLAKTCKLVPVMIMNKVLYKRTYPQHKYIVVGMITIGVSSFMLLKKSSDVGSSSVLGLVLVFINLAIDGAVNSTQDQIFARDKTISGQCMMCLMNLCSSALTLAWLLNPLNNELRSALAFLIAYPRAIVDIFIFAACGALGQCFIFYMLAEFGSLTLVAVTVTRKFLTILVSVVWYGHPLARLQWVAAGVVFAGIALDVYMKQRGPAVVKADVKREVVKEESEMRSVDRMVNSEFVVRKRQMVEVGAS